MPDEVVDALTDSKIIKTAFNAQFERTCLAKHLKTPMPPEQWRCSMAHALTLGLPTSLAGVAKCLKLTNQKMKEGKALIRYFSLPCRPTKLMVRGLGIFLAMIKKSGKPSKPTA